jgi:predicted kinase
MFTLAELLILSGLPASGKSSYAREWVAEDPTQRLRINYDDLRVEMFGPNWRFNRKQENEMQEKAKQQVIATLDCGKSVVIDNTNLSNNVRDRWAQLGQSLGAQVVQHEMAASVAECVRRDKLRLGPARVGRAVIERMALTYGFIDWNDYVGDFVIVDIDGTVANCDHRLHHVRPAIIHKDECEWKRQDCATCPECGNKPKKNWPAFFANVHLDEPIEPIVRMVKEYFGHFNVLFVTGRDTSIGIPTEEWIERHFFGCFNYQWHLFMRQGGDSREDTIIKKEILDYLPKDRIAYVLDDRDRVVEMYRNEGLTVLQPCKGAY